jgi:hypothetical protein
MRNGKAESREPEDGHGSKEAGVLWSMGAREQEGNGESEKRGNGEMEKQRS